MFKLKNQIIIATMVLFGIFVFISCEKEKPTEPTSNPTSRIQQMEIFKGAGVKHNQILDYVGKHCVPRKATPEQRFNIANQFTETKTTWNDMQQEQQDINQIVENKAKPSEKLFSLTKDMESEGVFLFDSLDAILDYYTNLIDSNTVVTPEEYNQKVNDLIDYVYANYNVYYDNVNDSANIYAIFVADCYVSMSSYEFWYNAAIDENNPWYDFLNGNNRSVFGRIWHAIKVAGADTWGFITGGWHIGNFNPDDNSWPIVWVPSEAVEHAGEVSSSVDNPDGE